MKRNFELHDWNDIKDDFVRPDGTQEADLLLGNGFSINVWKQFNYNSLLNSANFNSDTLDLFGNECNFETVLSDLHTTINTISTIEPESNLIDSLEEHSTIIRNGLIEAVGKVHVQAHKLRDTKIEFPDTGKVYDLVKYLSIEMCKYQHIYTTNYDLLCYWIAVEGGIVDHFPSDNPFLNNRARNYFLRRSEPHIFFLHGALHLWTSATPGDRHEEGKMLASKWLDLLETIRSVASSQERIPLFISEGSAQEKDQQIRESHYLSFCREVMNTRSSPLTILGHSLGPSDAHIRESIESHPDRKVAVGIYVPQNKSERTRETQKTMREFLSRLSGCNNVVFFDSKTHPLAHKICQIN